MATATTDKNIQIAQKEIGTVLKRYSLTWVDVAPDIDEKLWQNIKPLSKKIRKKIFRKSYPKMNARKNRR